MRGAAAFAIVALAAAACGGGNASAPVGTSFAKPGAPREDGGTGGPVRLQNGAIAGDFRTKLGKVNAARFVSNGHAAGRYEVDVYADEAGRAALAADAGVVPPGATFVIEHFERARDGAPGPIMQMQKREAGYDPPRGDWQYAVVGSNGEPVADGVIESCAGCHGDAPHDHLFRIVP